MTQSNHVQVAFPIPVRDVFTYVVPESLSGSVTLGSHVLASLGRRKLSGFVVGLEPRPDLKGIKPLQSLVRPEPVFNARMLELTRGVAEYYLCPLGEILAAAYPGHADKRPRRSLTDDSESAAAGVPAPDADAPTDAHTPKDAVAASDAIPANGAASSPAAGLNPRLLPLLQPSGGAAPGVFVLGASDATRDGLHVRLAEEIVSAGGSVLFLMPEVSASTTLSAFLKDKFGPRMALFHSMLRISQRKKVWEGCHSGALRVIVGTRSAVFLPLTNLRLIVVEEEHAQPYKQEETPRYNGRDVALMRAKLEEVPVVLASATPLVDTYLALKRNEYRPFPLEEEEASRGPAPGSVEPSQSAPKAAPGSSRPARVAVSVIDMRDWSNVVQGADVFSVPLVSAARQCLDQRRRVLIFLNRRGFSTYVQCQDCGAVETCPSCELPLVLHSSDGVLMCHHCGHRASAPSSCSKCKGVRFRFGGAGIEKVEAQLRKILPSARVGRMELDPSGTREEASAVAASFAKGELDVLIGTLIVMKGFELGDIALAGVIHAEGQLNIPDFRSGERSFELLSDVSSLVRLASEAGGRGSGVGGSGGSAGSGSPSVRGNSGVSGGSGTSDDTGWPGCGGRVLIQTLNPDHHSVRAVATGDPAIFYEQELKQREELGYPPFSTMVALHISGPREPQVLSVVKKAGSAATAVASSLERQGLQVRILGPSPAYPPRSRGLFRWRMSIIARKREVATRAAEVIMAELGGKHDIGGVTVSLDVDPVGA